MLARAWKSLPIRGDLTVAVASPMTEKARPDERCKGSGAGAGVAEPRSPCIVQTSCARSWMGEAMVAVRTGKGGVVTHPTLTTSLYALV